MDTDHGHRHVDVEACLDRAVSLWKTAAARLPAGEQAEVFHRVTRRLRVRAQPGQGWLIERGMDTGLAVRLRAGTEIGFAATSDASSAGLLWAVEECRRNRMAVPPGSGRLWADSSEVRDVERLQAEPEEEALQGWLQAAKRHERDSGVTASWVEWGCTVDCLVAHGELRTLRAISRCWALGYEGGAKRAERKAVLAGWSLGDLDPFRWDRWEATPIRAVAPGDRDRVPWILSPQVASRILRAFLPFLLSEEGHGDFEFWVDEEPGHPLRIAGGLVDDAGFPTARRRLFPRPDSAAPGLWRVSFMDPPRPRHGILVLGGKAQEAPQRFVWVSSVRCAPAGDGRFYVDMAGERVEDGCAAAFRWLGPGLWRPRQWARTVRGVVGEPRTCPDGTIAPALLCEPSDG